LALTVLVWGGALRTSALDLSLSGFGTYYDPGSAGEAWGGGAMLKLAIIDYVAVDARVSYLDIDRADGALIPLEAAATFQLPLFNKRLIPYAGVGVGYYLFEVDQVRIDDDWGVFPLAGISLFFGEESSFGLFAEVRYLFLGSDIESAADSALSSLNGDDVDGVAINVGVSYRF
jgi:outer membrane protein W